MGGLNSLIMNENKVIPRCARNNLGLGIMTRGYRILLMREADGVFAVVDIGSHEVYRR
jgi:hypothetical protein